jgi:putative ABC transport system permease protein
MVSQFPPLAFSSNQIEVEGMAGDGTTLPTAFTTIASRGYFETLGVPLLRGRLFTEQDRPGGPPLVVVNKAFVSRYLADREPIGSRMRVRQGTRQAGPFAEIIGVVGDTRNNGVATAPRPEAVIAMEQGRDTWNQLYLLVRSELDSAALVPSLRTVVASMDADQPVYNIQTMDEAVALSSFQQRVSAMIIGVFAGIALVLAAIGIYGVMSYSVSARTQEIGVRLAMGAERTDVIRMVLWQVARLVVVGVAIGVALLLGAGGALSGLLYGVSASDPLTIAVVSAALAAVALLAGWVPAWRASRVNPIQALRYE